MKGKKAQTSFEVILVATFALLIVLGMLRLVPSTMTAIGKTAVVKSEALKILDAQDKFYYIAEVKDAVTYHPGVAYDTITVLIGNVAPTENIAYLQAKFDAYNLSQKLVDTKFYGAAADVRVIVEKAP
jgi:hypothetical protein